MVGQTHKGHGSNRTPVPVWTEKKSFRQLCNLHLDFDRDRNVTSEGII